METVETHNMPTTVLTKPAWGGWGKISTPPSTCSLEDVMSQELAMELQIQEEAVEFGGMPAVVSWPATLGEETADTSSDFLIASMMQLEMDTEHDRQLRREQDKKNGTSKVKVSFDKYRIVHPALQADADFDDMSCLDAREVKIKKDSTPCFNRNGICGKGKNIITKHDPTICSRKNATKVMENFPPEFETGDGGNFDMRLPNTVYNQLKIHSNVEAKRSHRIHEKKEHATTIEAVDEKTRLIMYKLVNSGMLNAINGIVSTGKESVVFHADGGSLSSDVVVPSECALKVFKTTLAEFKNRCNYVKGDVRFFKDEFKKQNPRKIMRIWAEKEEMNLRSAINAQNASLRSLVAESIASVQQIQQMHSAQAQHLENSIKMERFHLPCPKVVCLKKHVLAMSFLGENRNPAPKLKEAKLSDAEWQIAYEQCVATMKRMFSECKLVHADLSEYNMLWYKDTVYFIDVAQAVDSMHPRAMEFLLRDCQNVSEFFTRREVFGVLGMYELFNDITGLALKGKGSEFLCQIKKYEKDERTMQLGMSKTDYPFDYFFERSCKERAAKKETEESAHEESPASDSDSENEEGTDVGVSGVREPDELPASDSATDDDEDDDSEVVEKQPATEPN